MDVRQLRALLAVADTGTFSAAADSLHTVQSNVSAHVARLEKELGTTLFDRSQATLTDAGIAVVRRARRILAEVDTLATDVAAARNEVVGDVRFGSIATVARWLTPPLFGAVTERHPLLRLIVREGTSAMLESFLINGALDIGVVMLPCANPDIATEPLFEEDLLLVVSSDHPLADRETVDLVHLSSIPLLMPPLGTLMRAEIDRAASDQDVLLQTKAEIDGVRLTASLVFDGFGPAILPATAVPPIMRERWHQVAVAGLPRRRVGLAHHRRNYPSAPARAMRALAVDLIRKHVSTTYGLHPPGAARTTSSR